MMHRVGPALLFVLTMVLCAAQVDAAVTFQSNNRVFAQLPDGTNSLNERNVTALPAMDVFSSALGGNSAQTSYNFFEQQGQAIFDWDVDLLRAGPLFNGAYVDGVMRFTVDAATEYAISGSLELSGGQRIVQSVHLFDLTASNFVFRSDNESQSTANAVFTAGQATGDVSSTRIGSTTGTLLAGQQYLFAYSYFIEAFPSGDSGAAAVGELTFTLGTASVPEPATLGIWSLLGLVFASNARRRKGRHFAAQG